MIKVKRWYESKVLIWPSAYDKQREDTYIYGNCGIGLKESHAVEND